MINPTKSIYEYICLGETLEDALEGGIEDIGIKKELETSKKTEEKKNNLIQMIGDGATTKEAEEKPCLLCAFSALEVWWNSWKAIVCLRYEET